jgi:hypothetical protein
MRAPHDDEERVHVSDPHAAPVLDTANALYNQMLRLLTQAFGRARARTADQARLLDAAICVMGILSAVAQHLTTLPASHADPMVRAGVSFTMLRATEPLIEDAGEWKFLGQRFEELADGLRSACREPAMRALALKLDELAARFLSVHQ